MEYRWKTLVRGEREQGWEEVCAPYDPVCARRIRRFHESLPDYHPTPMHFLPQLAESLGVRQIAIKDESGRFGLNAFKALGGSYAIARYLGEQLGIPEEECTFSVLTSERAMQQLGKRTFITATDGNHGRGVAYTARILGHQAVVLMPKGSAQERVRRIQEQGAQVTVTSLNYDDTVRQARALAEQNGWVLVQDTVLEGYREIPEHVMEGYTTLALECSEQLSDVPPTHLFLQAGVGSFAAAVLGFFARQYGEDRPFTAIVEPLNADCFYQTALAGDGKLHKVSGALKTMMAGLACGEPSPSAWDVLGRLADCFAAMPDSAAARAMCVLGNPLAGDPRMVSGESGASGFALALAALSDPKLEKLREALRLDRDSRILCISTEGATDEENYRRVVWRGELIDPDGKIPG